ncbi:MAG: DUF4248 domain-containing protein [Bacteroidaceae bacterium]|nr:DUF4248 domain-containing protein [Bacteroidaceae bacterium]MBQ8361040.1 DUF4248 domain-containing protein [Bacteroidaceae bacterium]
MKPITFSELANLYFGDYSAVWARKQMQRLIQANPTLTAEFASMPYRHRSFRFTPRQLALIYEQLGEP